ncbi:peptidoglycan D,D-transpeptidase FtsI family protein [Leucobacter komagatae]|uniref:Peptidoglycan glycosyltransferase n=1 Tax=Leucobacter komagatae TaxID=55969 RepID=A0A0D0ILE3_9MICO|nr:penicillin-binding protein 2 [Leucobacter komagatae]KIP52409.1 peptidoglycan glycosyltransferase [Leucobacter komagatae]
MLWQTLRGPRGRNLVVFAIVLIAGLAFMVRLVDLQMISAPQMNEDSREKRAVPITLPSVRGDIVDRNGDVLATTDERYDVQLSPKNVDAKGTRKFTRPDLERGAGTVDVTADEAFAEIGAITGQSGAEIKKIVDDALAENEKSDFAYVKRGVDLSQLQALKELYIPWLTFDSQHKRVYPNGAVGGNIVGFAGQDEVAQAGVELSQDECLAGVDGAETYERGADGVQLPGSVVQTKAAENGGTVELTLDRDLQWAAQQIINEQTQNVGAEYGYLVIQDVKTGELVAVAEDDSVDPNDVNASDSSRHNARAFVQSYEPGSTFKVITAAALIDQGKATPQSTVSAPGSWQPQDGVSFSDWFPHGTQDWTLTGTLVYSSNVGISMLGSRLSPEVRYDYLQKFGVGQPTNAGLPLEDTGLLADVADWDAQTSYVTMFGQGLSSTIVQTAGVFQAIANDGVRIPPSIVKSCTSASGKVTEPDHGDPVKVLSPEAAITTQDMLETTGTDGLVKDLVTIPGYRIGGKTGTAEQSDGQGGYRTDFVHSFAGVFPMDDPQYVIVATIGFPHGGDGTTAAVTAFHDAAESTIRKFRIPPSEGTYEKLPIGDETGTAG